MRVVVSEPVRPGSARDLVRRWQGGDVDLSRRLPSDLILSATEADPRIGQASPGYLTMRAMPSCLDPVEPLARAVYRSGWRRRHSPGPTRDELVDITRSALAGQHRPGERVEPIT